MSAKQPELTPEQQEQLIAAMAHVTDVVANLVEGLTKAILPIIESYNALPEPLKQRLAENQVKHHLEAAMKPEAEDYDRPYRVLQNMAAIDRYQKGEINIKEAAEQIEDRYTNGEE